jgi:hypothetical protein
VPVKFHQSETVSTVRLEGEVNICGALQLKGFLLEALASRTELQPQSRRDRLDCETIQSRPVGRSGTQIGQVVGRAQRSGGCHYNQ